MLINENMSNEEKFDTIFQVATGAYMDDTLDVGSPCGCFVGNLIATACGVKVIKAQDGVHWHDASPNWGHKFSTVSKAASAYRLHKRLGERDTNKLIQEDERYAQFMRKDFMVTNVQEAKMADYELSQIGLPMEVILGIEFQFESNARTGQTRENQMYRGLTAVLEYLSIYFGLTEPKRNSAKSLLNQVFEN